jgi:catechol 2,3-dioxygenase-like lactoylglutathione lyase family enzyme
MLSHVTAGTQDLARAEAFYSRVLEPLGVIRLHGDDRHVGYGLGVTPSGTPIRPMFWICLPFDGRPALPGNGWHVAFTADSRGAVDAVYAAARALGAQCEGPPGPRPHYHDRYYGAFFRDPDGNKVQVCCHHASF